MDMLENPSFFASVVIGGILLAAISAGFQYMNEENNKQIKPKAVLRDGILGVIFTAMAWSFFPDTMSDLSSSVTSKVSAATTESVKSAVRSGGTGGGFEYDIQVGPARF
jgi:hypothetical protein